MAAVIAHEEISASDPGFCLAYLAHAMLCANNLAANCSEEQKELSGCRNFAAASGSVPWPCRSPMWAPTSSV